MLDFNEAQEIMSLLLVLMHRDWNLIICISIHMVILAFWYSSMIIRICIHISYKDPGLVIVSLLFTN